MKKVLICSLLSASAIEATGAIINIISYFTTGKLLLAQQLYGGECCVWRGFGVALTEVYPMMRTDGVSYKTTSWLSFEYTSFRATLILGFLLSFVVCSIIYAVKIKLKGNPS